MKKNIWMSSNGYGFRELDTIETEQVNGARIADSAVTGFDYGAAAGTIFGAVFTGTTIGATRWGIIGAALGASAGFGWGVGTTIYKFVHSY